MPIPIQPRDQLGHFMPPQAPEEAGYYVYGNVKGVAGTGHLAQYAHPTMLTVIFQVEREWQAIDDRKFGIGNISVAGGFRFDHATHMKGIDMDIRPVRKDKIVGQAARCSYRTRSTIRQLRSNWSACLCGTPSSSSSTSTTSKCARCAVRL